MKMKVYKSRFLPKVEKAARKARSLKRGALYAHYIIGKGICTFIQGAYAVRGAVTTGSTDENDGSYLCEFDLEINPHDHFFVDSKGNATQTNIIFFGFIYRLHFTTVININLVGWESALQHQLKFGVTKIRIGRLTI